MIRWNACGAQLILHEFATAGYVMPETVIDEYVEERIRAPAIRTLQVIAGGRLELRKIPPGDARPVYESQRTKNISGEPSSRPQDQLLPRTNDYKMDDEVKLRMIVLNIVATPRRCGSWGRNQRKIKRGGAEMAQFIQPAGPGGTGDGSKIDRDGALCCVGNGRCCFRPLTNSWRHRNARSVY